MFGSSKKTTGAKKSTRSRSASGRKTTARRKTASSRPGQRLLWGALAVETVWLGLFIWSSGRWLPEGLLDRLGSTAGQPAAASRTADPSRSAEAAEPKKDGDLSISLPSLPDVGDLLLTEEQRDSKRIREMLANDSGDSTGE